MDKLDSKLIYNLLISNNILKYLCNDDKRELSSCCKFIYEKSTKIRLENFKFVVDRLQAYIGNTKEWFYWGYENYEFKVDYLNTIANKHKNHLLRLAYTGEEYNIIEYFSLKFTNLTSISLGFIIIPDNIYRNIFKNLQNLRSLSLLAITVGYSKNDTSVTDFKFSKYLKDLRCNGCYQLELDSTDYSSIYQHGFGTRFNNRNIMDLSFNLYNTIQCLYWEPDCYFNDEYDNRYFNETIANNPGLTSLETTLNCFNSDSFKLISSNSNLTKLTIIFRGYHDDLDSSILSKLPNIKTLEYYQNLEENSSSFYLLIENIPNLEELKLSYFSKCNNYLTDYIKNQLNLKVLTIYSDNNTILLLYSILPESNLEKLEIISRYPIKFNFNNFINLKKLKLISNSYKFYNLEDKNEIHKQESLEDWRTITYPTSIWYWKTK